MSVSTFLTHLNKLNRILIYKSLYVCIRDWSKPFIYFSTFVDERGERCKNNKKSIRAFPQRNPNDKFKIIDIHVKTAYLTDHGVDVIAI